MFKKATNIAMLATTPYNPKSSCPSASRTHLAEKIPHNTPNIDRPYVAIVLIAIRLFCVTIYYPTVLASENILDTGLLAQNESSPHATLRVQTLAGISYIHRKYG